MTALIAFLLLALLAVGVSRLRLHAGQFRVSAPMVGPLFVDGGDADERRVNHDLDAVRTRFEQHPTWPSSGVLGERR
ncbi:hypothetical protein H7J51_12950 [Mycobacterium crocinum]|uniref:Uncharacterized protein n=1 Tax=Mycolicibacterium crocinum TaxID=388459 RepID=A0ABY3TI09_9MYCO|nr:hypothetical protein [Mycolicibacterium crocinum]MCV7216189.1 hypothetical protein [Mycolicibacterium crocinum]ULN41115.1 hypothetical protein MI149_26495 [Mycolicibacterium crocinum]